MGSSGGATDFNATGLTTVDTMPPPISAPQMNGKEPHPLLTQRDSIIFYT